MTREEVEVAYCEVPDETSLSKLDDHDWTILSNRWMRGIDWNVSKIGRKWTLPSEHFAAFPLFKTKRAAGEVMDTLVLTESKIRSRRRLLAELDERGL